MPDCSLFAKSSVDIGQLQCAPESEAYRLLSVDFPIIIFHFQRMYYNQSENVDSHPCLLSSISSQSGSYVSSSESI